MYVVDLCSFQLFVYTLYPTNAKWSCLCLRSCAGNGNDNEGNTWPKGGLTSVSWLSNLKHKDYATHVCYTAVEVSILDSSNSQRKP